MKKLVLKNNEKKTDFCENMIFSRNVFRLSFVGVFETETLILGSQVYCKWTTVHVSL